MSRKVIKKVKHKQSNMHLTSADALPLSDTVTLQSAEKSQLKLDIVCLNRKRYKLKKGGE